MNSESWRHAQQSDIDNMSISEALEIIDKQIAAGTLDINATNPSYKPKAPFTKVLIIIRQLAIEHIDHCMKEDNNHNYQDKRYWLNLDTDRVKVTDAKTKLDDPYKEISKSLYCELVKRGV